jgi:hypothetical protein
VADSRFVAMLKKLLADTEADLDAVERPVGRSLIVPGIDEAWDDCCNGQLSVRVLSITPSGRPFPSQDLSACPALYAALIGLTVIRCAATSADDGTPPPAAALTSEALGLLTDMAIMRRALLGLMDEGSKPRGLETVRLSEWFPKGPQGGCVGGEWQAYLGMAPCFDPILDTP